MQIEMTPDLASFRGKVDSLKDTDLYKEPRVKALLLKIMEAVKQPLE